MGWTARFSKEYCWLLVDTPKDIKSTGFKLESFPNLQVFNDSIRFLRSSGWKIKRDPDVHKNYRILSDQHRYARKGSLELSIEINQAMVEFKFFQNVVFENKSGGQYDFDKYKKMPYLIKLLFLNETKKLSDFLHEKFSCVTKNTDLPETSAEHIVALQNSNSFTRGEMKNLKEIPVKYMSDCDFKHNSTDRDKKNIECGQTKYFRHWNGRLYRGQVWHNINNMWWVIINKYNFTNIASFELFDLTSEDIRHRRLKAVKLPKEYIEKIESLKKLSTKELEREIKKRKLEVSHV